MPEASHASRRSRRSKRSRRRGRRRAGGAGSGGMPTCALRNVAYSTEQLRGRAGAGGATTNRRYSRSDDSAASGGAKCGRRVLPPFARFSIARAGRARARRTAPVDDPRPRHSCCIHHAADNAALIPRRQSPFPTKWYSHWVHPCERVKVSNINMKDNVSDDYLSCSVYKTTICSVRLTRMSLNSKIHRH